MSDLKHRVWWCRWTPTNLIQLHPTLDLHLNDGQPWFETLVEDIKKNGLNNPILVHNQTAPCDHLVPCRVAHGSNRYRAVRRLGWKYIPTLIVGELPTYFRRGGAQELHSLAECQSYINDGTFVNYKWGCRIKDSIYAQEMRYVRRADPFFDKPE